MEPSATNRYATSAEWAASSYILPVGMAGYETNTARHKWGDGVNIWVNLAYPEETVDSDTTFATESEWTGDLESALGGAGFRAYRQGRLVTLAFLYNDDVEADATTPYAEENYTGALPVGLRPSINAPHQSMTVIDSDGALAGGWYVGADRVDGEVYLVAPAWTAGLVLSGSVTYVTDDIQ